MSASRPPLLVAVLAAAVVLAGAAPAPTPPSMWAQSPTPAQLHAARPAGALPETIGRAAATCKAGADGGLADCRLRLDSPAGAGFGAALLALVPQYRLDLAAPHAPAAGSEVWVSHIWEPENRRPGDKPVDWLRKPTQSEILKVWPAKAWAAGQGGQAVISCLVSLQGALFDCATISERPAGSDFGDAALALAPQLLMRPAMHDGKPVVAPVNVPINFYLPPGSSTPRSNFGARPVIGPAMAWPQAPSYADVAAAYPAKARAAKTGGRATLSCEFARDGRLIHCETIAEEPRREGFGDAAKALAGRFRGPLTLSDGKSIAGAKVELPVVFDPAMLADGQPVIGKALWASLPSAEDTQAAFGKLQVASAAHVRLACVVLQGGSVEACRVEQEDPAGAGVGAAALGLAPHFRLTTWTNEGLPTVGGTINIPLRYELKDAAPKG